MDNNDDELFVNQTAQRTPKTQSKRRYSSINNGRLRDTNASMYTMRDINHDISLTFDSDAEFDVLGSDGELVPAKDGYTGASHQVWGPPFGPKRKTPNERTSIQHSKFSRSAGSTARTNWHFNEESDQNVTPSLAFFRLPRGFFNNQHDHDDAGTCYITPPTSTRKARRFHYSDASTFSSSATMSPDPLDRDTTWRRAGAGDRPSGLRSRARKQVHRTPSALSTPSLRLPRILLEHDRQNANLNLSQPPAGLDELMSTLSEIPDTLNELHKQYIQPMHDLADKVNALTEQVNKVTADNAVLRELMDTSFQAFADDTNKAVLGLEVKMQETIQACDEVMAEKEFDA